MQKRFIVLIEDDFEVLGNGLGNVADLQYLPGLAFMNTARKHGAKLTFMVDVAHQLVMSKHTHHNDIRIQKELWDQTIHLMMERGFDVQLHLHPQWIEAQFKDGYFYLNDNWNIGCYSAEQQQSLISEAVGYLNNLLRPDFPQYKTCAFKAGSWGMQPASRTLLTALRAHGINIIMGARDGLTVTGNSVDYTNMEEKYLPYHPDFDDLTRISKTDNGVLMLPLQPYQPSLVTLSRFALDRVKDRLQYRMSLQRLYEKPVPGEIRQLNPETGKNMFHLSLRPYHTHLKIGNQPFSYLKDSFDTVIKKLRKLENERIPIVIESHTKQFKGYYEDIDRFLGYINERYDNEVEFGDMTSFSKELRISESIET